MNTHRRVRAGLVTATLMLFLLSLTFLVPAHARGLTSNHAATGRPIYIGHVTTLTGRNATADRPPYYWRIGIRLAIRQINAHGGIHGRPLKLVLADDKSSADFSGDISAFTELTTSGHIAAIIGPGYSPMVQALTPSIKEARIPVMIGGSAPNLTHEGNPWVFRTGTTATYVARALSAFTVNTLHQTKIALIHTDPAVTEASMLLRVNLKKLGITPVVDLTEPSFAPDLTAQVLAIKRSGAKALISMLADDRDYVMLAQQMHEAGVHLTWVGNVVMSDEQVRRQGGALFYGTYATTDFAAGQSPEALAFDRLSKSILHLPANHDSAGPYDGVQILARVMRGVGTKPQAIRRGILALRGYRGVMGTYNFDKHGDGVRQDTVVQNVRGQLRVVKVLSF